MKPTILSLALALGVGALALAQDEGIQIDPKLPRYQPVEGVSGNLKSAGSDTMLELMSEWTKGYKGFYPNVSIEVEGKGSSSAPPALTEGTATFGPMSREMKDTEMNAFEKKYGYKPTRLSTAIDMLAVFVHKDNPIEGLTLKQVDAIFSRTRKGGYEKDLVTWGELGLTGDWVGKPISLYGRNSTSGTYGYFKEHALFKGDFKPSVKEQPGSSAVVQGVGSDRYAIGYSGIGTKTADVRIVPLAHADASEFVPAEPEYAYTGEYPLARPLFVYLNHEPKTALDPLRREFLHYVYSHEGQERAVDAGYLPMGAHAAGQELAKVGLKLRSPKKADVSGGH